MAWKLSIKGNFFYAEEQGGTNLCHEYPQIQCRFGKKYNDSTKYTFYQNHTGLVIDRLENLEWTEFLDSTGTPFASQLAFETWCNENLSKIGAGGGGTPTAEIDVVKTGFVPVVYNNTQYYIQEKSVVDNTTGSETPEILYFDSSLNSIAPLPTYVVGKVKKNDADFVKTYYAIGGITYEGYSRLVNGVQVIYDLEFIEVVGAVSVQEPNKTVTVSNQTTVGNTNKHYQVLAGSSLPLSTIKCISFLIKGDCTIEMDGVVLDYEDGDSFSFSSENVLVNDITINQITGKTNILTLE